MVGRRLALMAIIAAVFCFASTAVSASGRYKGIQSFTRTTKSAIKKKGPEILVQSVIAGIVSSVIGGVTSGIGMIVHATSVDRANSGRADNKRIIKPEPGLQE